MGDPGEDAPFVDGGAVLSIVCAVAGGASYLGAAWIEETTAVAIARALLGDRTAAGDLASVASLAAVPVLGIAAVVLGLMSRWRIRGAGTTLSGGGLALLGIGAGSR